MLVPVTFVHTSVLFWVLYFLKNKDGLFCVFPTQPWNESFLQRTLIFMIGYWFLETKVLVLVVLIATGISGNRVRKYIIIADIRTQRGTYAHIFIFISVLSNLLFCRKTDFLTPCIIILQTAFSYITKSHSQFSLSQNLESDIQITMLETVAVIAKILEAASTKGTLSLV